MKNLHIIISIISIFLPLISIVLLITNSNEYNSLFFLVIFLLTSLFQVWFIRKYNINITHKIR